MHTLKNMLQFTHVFSFNFFASFTRFIHGFLMVHLNSTVKNAYFEEPASIYSWIFSFLQTSIDLPMGFLMVHLNSTVKNAYFEKPVSVYSWFFYFFASFTQFIHGFFDGAPQLDCKKCILWRTCINLLMCFFFVCMLHSIYPLVFWWCTSTWL